jgi:sensor c-di-GMP phosphodiesterase-like protein
MHDLILEIDSILWWAVIAFAILAVVLSLLAGEKGVKRAPDIILNKAEPATPHTRPGADKSIGTRKKTTGTPADSAAISEYRSAKLWSCAREIKMLEQLNLVTGSWVEPEPTQRQPETKRDQGDKKRGIWD